MAAVGFFALLDDIATLLDDVAVMTKVAAKKTAGVLGDDLALNAEQVTGMAAQRELPVVWAVAKGSLVNKGILVPAALALSALAPWLVTPLLMFGGLFLCYEGVEKLAHRLLHSKEEDQMHHDELAKKLTEPVVDPVALEKDKIKGAIRTDLVLSAEIVAITLGTIADQPFLKRVLVLSGIGLLMTVGVYGLVAGIVKLDDLGLHLNGRKNAAMRALGRGIVGAAPFLMRLLSIAGTVAVFLVGGGILMHGIPGAHDWVHHLAEGLGAVGAVVPTVIDGVAGVIAGVLALGVVLLATKVFRKLRAAKPTKG